MLLPFPVKDGLVKYSHSRRPVSAAKPGMLRRSDPIGWLSVPIYIQLYTIDRAASAGICLEPEKKTFRPCAFASQHAGAIGYTQSQNLRSSQGGRPWKAA